MIRSTAHGASQCFPNTHSLVNTLYYSTDCDGVVDLVNTLYYSTDCDGVVDLVNTLYYSTDCDGVVDRLTFSEQGHHHGPGDAMDDVEPSVPVVEVRLVVNHWHSQGQDEGTRVLGGGRQRRVVHGSQERKGIINNYVYTCTCIYQS